MIVRIWRGRTSRDNARGYESHITNTVFPALVAIDGYRGGRLARRDIDAQVEFVVLTEWASWDAIQAFAGANPDRAVVEPAAKALLSSYDELVQHFIVVVESSGGPPPQ
jgi:heme-degrading monooxygenase HmoA